MHLAETNERVNHSNFELIIIVKYQYNSYVDSSLHKRRFNGVIETGMIVIYRRQFMQYFSRVPKAEINGRKDHH